MYNITLFNNSSNVIFSLFFFCFFFSFENKPPKTGEKRHFGEKSLCDSFYFHRVETRGGN